MIVMIRFIFTEQQIKFHDESYFITQSTNTVDEKVSSVKVVRYPVTFCSLLTPNTLTLISQHPHTPVETSPALNNKNPSLVCTDLGL